MGGSFRQLWDNSKLIFGGKDSLRACTLVICSFLATTSLFLSGLSGCAAPKRVYRQPTAEAGAADRPIPDWDRTSDQYQTPGMQAASLALAQIGRPYRYGGENPSGFDCSGLVLYVYGLLDVSMPRTVSEQARMGLSVTTAEAHPGDLLFFRLNGSRISHVGVYAGGNVFVHAPSTGQAVEQESLTNTWWRERLVSVRRVIRN